MATWAEERREFIRICRRAFLAGMQVSSGGNISMRLKGGLFMVKPSGISLFELRGEDLLVVDGSGNLVEGGSRPTRDLRAHLGIYGVRGDVGGIVHYHSPFATAYAIRGEAIPLETVHSRRILKRVPVIPPAEDGSDAMASLVREAFSDPGVRAAVLSGHGIIAAGSNLRSAEDLAELLEECAKIALLSRFAGPGDSIQAPHRVD
ncbi:MAG: class II aldolase/adducin family protein [Candidatus Bathyarchaeia archaeon]